MRLYFTDTEIRGFKDFGVTSLTFWGHVTSSVTWPLDSAWALSYWWSMMTMRVSCTDTEIRSFKNFGVTSLTFWGHVTSSVTWPLDSAYVFLLVVHWNHASTLHRYGDIWPQRYWGHDFGLLRSRDVIGHLTIDSAYVVSYWWSIGTKRLSCTVTEI